jgi:hypothetical protein
MLMRIMKRCIVLAGLAVSVILAGCASSPAPFEYEQNNELKPGPGLLTGEEGVYTIYGEPGPAKKEEPVPDEEVPAKSDTQ